jgi:tRNA 2-thiouridine synthesizing protein C
MTPRRILFVIAHGPHRGALPFEMLDELLVGAVFEQIVSVLFIGDGVYQLIDSGETDRNVARGFRALPTYDVDAIFVERAALKRRGLAEDALTLPVRALTNGAMRRLIAAHDVVVPD